LEYLLQTLLAQQLKHLELRTIQAPFIPNKIFIYKSSGLYSLDKAGRDLMTCSLLDLVQKSQDSEECLKKPSNYTKLTEFVVELVAALHCTNINLHATHGDEPA